MANPDITAVNNLYGGNAGWNLGNSETKLMEVDSGHICKINTILVANVDGTNSADVTLSVQGMGSGNDGVTTTCADATIYLAKTVPVPADSTLSILDAPIYLMEADELHGGASAASDLDLFISFETIDVA